MPCHGHPELRLLAGVYAADSALLLAAACPGSLIVLRLILDAPHGAWFIRRLDTLHLYDAEIWGLYHDDCGENLNVFLAYLLVSIPCQICGEQIPEQPPLPDPAQMDVMAFLEDMGPEYRKMFLDAVEACRREDFEMMADLIASLADWYTPEDGDPILRELIILVRSAALTLDLSEEAATLHANPE